MEKTLFHNEIQICILFKSTITFSFPLMKISGPNVKLPHWVLKKLDKFTYYPNWKCIHRNIWTVELWKICLCFRGNNSIMEENFFQWNVPNLWKKAVLIFATLQDFFGLSLIQQILTEQKRSFIKGLSNKDSIELLRYNDFFSSIGGCLLW